MKPGTLLLLAGGGLLLWKYLGLARAGSVMHVVFKDFTFSNLTTVKIRLTLQNPSNSTLQVNSLVGDISINGHSLGDITSFTQVTILPNSQQDIIIDLGVSIFGLPGIIKDIITDPLKNYQVVINGTVNANGIIIPISTEENFDLAI